MIRVFHFIMDHRMGGPHVYVLSLSRLLARDVSPTIVTTGMGVITDVPLFYFRHLSRWLFPFEVAANIARIVWLFRSAASRRRVVVDVHGAANIAPIVAAALLGMPVVWHFHEAIEKFRPIAKVGRLLLRRVPHVLAAVSHRSMDTYQLSGAELLRDPIDIEYWRMPDAHRGARGQSAVTRLVSVGNLNPLKGMDTLLDAMALFPPPWELVIIGAELATNREYAESLYTKAGQLGVAHGVVRFMGWQPAGAVRDMLANADIFVLLSKSEAGPIALFEAMAMECMCVISDVGDVREILGGHGSGLIVENVSPEKVAGAIQSLRQLCSEDRMAMGKRARERVLHLFCQDEIAKRHLNIYSSLASQ